MRSFQKKGKLSSIIQSKYFLILFGLLLIVFIYSLFGFVNKMQETIRNKEVLQNKIFELEKNKEKLISDLNKLKTDQGVEENIREKFGLAKEGENMIMIIEDSTTPKEDNQNNTKGILPTIKNWFK